MHFYKFFKVFLLITAFSLNAFGQINIVVSDFINKSDILKLDAWERNLPVLIKSHLSVNNQITVLDRGKLDKVFEEQALTLSGLMDSSEVQNIGKLLNADFILSGSVDKQNDDFIISADLIRVKTGQVQTEIVRSQNSDLRDAMVEMLANNLLYNLTGDGNYQNEKMFKSNSVWYWVGSTLLLGGATFYTNTIYHDNYDSYNSATTLKDFDKYYDRTNLSKDIYLGLAIVTSAALIATFVDLLMGDDGNTIKGGRVQQPATFKNSSIYVSGNREISVGIQINF